MRVQKFLTPARVESLNLNLTDLIELNNLLTKFQPDSIIHLAAQAGVRLPVGQWNKYVESNLIGFTNILQAAVQQEIPNFLYASSSSIYGNFASIPYKEAETSLKPSSYYGATKLFNEQATETIIKKSNTRARGLRLFTVYGPWGRPDMAYFRMIANIISGSKFSFFGDGSIERDFTYIEDVVSMIEKLNFELATKEFGYNDVVNIGGGRPLSMNFLADYLADYSGIELRANKLARNADDALRTMADPTRLIQLIGEKPETKLEEGIKKTIEWASSNQIKPLLKSWVDSSL